MRKDEKPGRKVREKKSGEELYLFLHFNHGMWCVVNIFLYLGNLEEERWVIMI